jgi:hypothetical protein
MASAWVAVVVTYYRFVAVSRPLHARLYITMSRVKFVIASVWICTAILYIPFIAFRLFFLRLNITEALFTCLQLLFSSWLPISFTIFFNIRLIFEVNNSRTFCVQQLPSRDCTDNRSVNNRRRVTVTMTVIVIVYLVCQLPSAIIGTISVIDSFMIELFRDNLGLLFYNIGVDAGVFLIVINSLFDCVTYFLMGKRCREILSSALFCCRINDK